MTFWSAATAEAGRQFGRRYWRWFAFTRIARRLGPALVTIAVVGLVAFGGFLAYRFLSPDWSLAWSTVTGAAPVALRWIIVAAVTAGATWAAVVLWRAQSWRWSRF